MEGFKFAEQQNTVTDEENKTYTAKFLKDFCEYVMHPESDLHKDADEWIRDKLTKQL